MSTEQYKQGTGKTLDQIAALMAENRNKMQEQREQRQAARKPGVAAKPVTQLGEEEEIEDAEVVEEEVEEEDAADEDLETEEEGESEEEGGEGTGEDDDADDDADDDEDEEDADSDGDFLEVDDDTLVELDGEDEPVSLATLKAAYKADKEIPLRLKQIEAEYQTATQTRTKAVADGAKMSEAMQALIQAVDKVVATPIVQQPNAALKTSNPALYLQQLEAYQQDQQRIAGSRQAVLDALKAHNTQLKETKEGLKQAEMNILLQKIPALKAEDQKLRGQASKDIIDAAAFYGFTPDEVNEAADHRIFQMAYDAQQYRKLKGIGKKETEEKTTKLKTKISQQPKVLRSGGTSAKNRVTNAHKRVQVLKSRAKSTGRPEDVAAFMSSTRQLPR